MDYLEYFISRKLECSQCISNLCISKMRVVVGYFLKYRFIIMKNMMLLIVIADLYFGSESERAIVGFDHLI